MRAPSNEFYNTCLYNAPNWHTADLGSRNDMKKDRYLTNID